MSLKTVLCAVALAASMVVVTGVHSVVETRAEASEAESATLDYNTLLPIIEAQLSQLRNGDVKKAYADYTSSSFRKNTSFEDYKALVDQYKVLSNNKAFQYRSFYFEDGVAIFGGDLVSVEGNAIPVEFDLIKENGHWKIMGLQLFHSEHAPPPRD